MDYATGRNIRDDIPRYWVWDFESDKANHSLPLREERIESMDDIGEGFEPATFVTWRKPWTVARDWGAFS